MADQRSARAREHLRIGQIMEAGAGEEQQQCKSRASQHGTPPSVFSIECHHARFRHLAAHDDMVQ
jgi:hypothetical protein